MAIAFGAYTHFSSASGAGPFTFSHTASSATGTILFVSVATASAVTVTGISYNGVAMVSVGSTSVNSARITLYRMYNPPSGAHTVSISVSGATNIEAGATDYTDPSPSGPGIDQVNTFTTAGTAMSQTLTPTSTGMWMITVCCGQGPDATASTNCILRSGVSAQLDMGVFDNNTNGMTGGSPFTMTQTAGGVGNDQVSCTFSVPAVASGLVPSRLIIRQAVNRASTY